MAILSRRVLQQMINENARILSAEQTKKHVADLNRIDVQSIPIEWEVAVLHGLAQLGEAAQQTVDSLRQSSQAIAELNHVAIGLRGGVSRFTLQAA